MTTATKNIKHQFALSPAHAARHLLEELVEAVGEDGAREVARCMYVQADVARETTAYLVTVTTQNPSADAKGYFDTRANAELAGKKALRLAKQNPEHYGQTTYDIEEVTLAQVEAGWKVDNTLD